MVTTAAALSIDAISVALDGSTILDAVSLEAAPGAVTSVIGPSGSGKTTLLRAIAGLTPLHDGRVVVDGRDQADVAVHARGLGLVGQDASLFPHLRVGANVAFGLQVRGWSRAARRVRAREVLAMVGLADLEDRSVQGLSGGERQRVALARAIAPEPRVLLLDEPFGALDRSLRERLVEEVAQLVDAMGLTTIHVTHDQEEAATLGAELVVLREGRVAQHGAPSQIHAAPIDAWVARFVGHRNVLDAADVPLPLLDALATGERHGAVLVPEGAVRIVDSPSSADGAIALTGRVRSVHAPPARPGVLIDLDVGGALWAALPHAPPDPGRDVVIAVRSTSMQSLPNP